MINAPAGKSRPQSWTWLNLTLTVVYQKDSLNLVISDYLKALYDRGNLRLKLGQNGKKDFAKYQLGL